MMETAPGLVIIIYGTAVWIYLGLIHGQLKKIIMQLEKLNEKSKVE